MIIAVPKETISGERRVALVPEAVGRLVRAGHDLRLEPGAGAQASFTDAAYQAAGGTVKDAGPSLWSSADLVLRVQKLTAAEAGLPREGAAVIGMLAPFANRDVVQELARRR